MTDDSQNTLLAAKARLAQWAVWMSYSGLLLMQPLRTVVWPSCERAPNPVVGLLLCVPLLIFLPGILKRSTRSHIWLCFVSMGYFLLAVTGFFNCASALAALELLFIVVLFIAAMMFSRWYAQLLRQGDC